MMKRLKKLLLLLVFVALIILFFNIIGLSIEDIASIKLPEKDTIVGEAQKELLLAEGSFFERQGYNQCAGFASAYLLRTVGVDIDGARAYSQLPYTFANGYVLPSSLSVLFSNKSLSLTMYTGTLETLKLRLSAGLPVIVLLGNSVRWQHYVTVVGYDEENIYLYDSNRDIEGHILYNRVMSNADFLSQWNNKIPGFQQVYFVLSQNKAPESKSLVLFVSHKKLFATV